MRTTCFQNFTGLLIGVVAMICAPVAASAASDKNGEAEIVEIKGELIDTWCYLSGVMGGPDAVTGTAHHTCAIWCAAGGIPVGVKAEDGTIYMVLKFNGENPLPAKDTLLELQSHVVTARGAKYVRDGINYLAVEKVVSDAGIETKSHEDYGPVPPFAVPEKKS